ncbi:MAG: ABC transporter permease [Chloroflexi bacterium]|nr:ABC transporter permease [Chloroflexota bacterium]
MLLRILSETFTRRKKRLGLAVLAVLLGSALATALLSISSEIMDKITREMRSYGANILVVPESDTLQLEIGGVNLQPVASQRYLDERVLYKLKTIFWRNNILGFTPYLDLVVRTESQERTVLIGTWFDKEVAIPSNTAIRTGFAEESAASEPSSFRTGVKSVSPWWRVQGRWASDDAANEAMVGVALAQKLGLRPGDPLTVAYQGTTLELGVVGIVTTGSYEDSQIFAPLPTAQRLLGISNRVSKLLVSALTMPKEKLAPDIRNKPPEDMTPAEYEKWYCSPILDAVVTQIKEVIPEGDARPIRQISEAEGSFAVKIQLLMILVTGVALLASALGVLTTMTTTVLERRGEIGLMKAIGAENGQVAMVFLTEAALVGLLGGVLGYAVGIGLAAYVGRQVFSTVILPSPFVLPVALVLAIGIALLGSALPVRTAMKVEPTILLRGN